MEEMMRQADAQVAKDAAAPAPAEAPRKKPLSMEEMMRQADEQLRAAEKAGVE